MTARSYHDEGRLFGTDGHLNWVEPALLDEPDGSFARPFHCENADCGNELTFDDIQAGDELCSYCAEREQ
jgi:hypothetical protein